MSLTPAARARRTVERCSETGDSRSGTPPNPWAPERLDTSDPDLPERSCEGQEYRLRLESTVPGATVPEQQRAITTIGAALRGLERLVNESSVTNAQQG